MYKFNNISNPNALLLEGFVTPICRFILKKSGLQTPPTIADILKLTPMVQKLYIHFILGLYFYLSEPGFAGLVDLEINGMNAL